MVVFVSNFGVIEVMLLKIYPALEFLDTDVTPSCDRVVHRTELASIEKAEII